jgi:uncharacterized protein YodC (DUF2158 family)
MSEISEGAVVELKCGGPRLVVTRLNTDETADVSWCDPKSSDIRHGTIAVVALKPHEPKRSPARGPL